MKNSRRLTRLLWKKEGSRLKLNSIPWRKILVYLIYILLLPAIQVTLGPRFTLMGQTADLMLVFAVLVGFMYGFYDGMIVGGIVGIIRDIFAAPVIPGPGGSLAVSFGVGALVLFLAGVFGAIFFEDRTNRNFPLGLLAVFFYSIIYKLVGHLVIYAWESFIAGMSISLDIGVILRDSLLISVLLNCVAAIPLYFLLRFIGPVSWNGKKRENNKELTYGDSGKWLTI